MAAESTWPPVRPGFMNIVELGNYHHFVNPADQKIADNLNLTLDAVRKVRTARQLFEEGSSFLVEERSQAMEELIDDVAAAVSRVQKLLQPGRVERLSDASVRINMSTPLVLRSEDPKTAATFGRLVLTCNRMETVIHDLQNIQVTAQLDSCAARATNAIKPKRTLSRVFELEASRPAKGADAARLATRRSKRRSTIPQTAQNRARSTSRRRSQAASKQLEVKPRSLTHNKAMPVSGASLMRDQIPCPPGKDAYDKKNKVNVEPNQPKYDSSQSPQEQFRPSSKKSDAGPTQQADITKPPDDIRSIGPDRSAPVTLIQPEAHSESRAVVRRKPVPKSQNPLTKQMSTAPKIDTISPMSVSATTSISANTSRPVARISREVTEPLNNNAPAPDTGNHRPWSIVRSTSRNHVIYQIDPELTRLPSLLRPGHKDQPPARAPYPASEADSEDLDIAKLQFKRIDTGYGSLEDVKENIEEVDEPPAASPLRNQNHRFSANSLTMRQPVNDLYSPPPPQVPDKPIGYSNLAPQPGPQHPNPLRSNPTEKADKRRSLDSVFSSRRQPDSASSHLQRNSIASSTLLPREVDTTGSPRTMATLMTTAMAREPNADGSRFRDSRRSSMSTAISSQLSTDMTNTLIDCTEKSHIHNQHPFLQHQRPHLENQQSAFDHGRPPSKPPISQHYVYRTTANRPTECLNEPTSGRAPQPRTTGVRRRNLATVDEDEIAPDNTAPVRSVEDRTKSVVFQEPKKQPSWFSLKAHALRKKK